MTETYTLDYTHWVGDGKAVSTGIGSFWDVQYDLSRGHGYDCQFYVLAASRERQFVEVGVRPFLWETRTCDFDLSSINGQC